MRKMKLGWAVGLVLAMGWSCSFAHELFDRATPPDQVADVIVVYTPEVDMDLDKMKPHERGFRGRIEKQEKGDAEPLVIVQRPNSMIMPLQAGVPVRLYLKRFDDRDAYYPIAIFPVSSGAEK